MWGAPVLEKKDSLPNTQSHFPTDYRDYFRGPGQRHPDMAWHIISTLVGVDEIGRVLGYQAVKKCMEVCPRGRVGVLHDDETGTGVLHKYGHCPGRHLALPHYLGNFRSDLVSALPSGIDGKLVCECVHWKAISAT